jgi:pimeloyl-ACP methyl ester carboxylesterase
MKVVLLIGTLCEILYQTRAIAKDQEGILIFGQGILGCAKNHVVTTKNNEMHVKCKVGRQSLRDYLTFLEQIVATREDRRPPIIIGHSMGGLLAQQLAARMQPLALVLLTPAAPYGINGLSLTNIGALLAWMSNGAFWRKAYKQDFAGAQRYAFRGLPTDRHWFLYEGMVHESGRAIFEICLWPLDFLRAAAHYSGRCQPVLARS